MMKPRKLWNTPERGAGSLTPFLLPGVRPRPAVLVIPGGGYGTVCEATEGTPIALMFNKLGYHAFVLDYRVAPHAFPAPLEDAVRAVKIIRGHAAEWQVLPDRVVSCGFSAGGHLAGALGLAAELPEAAAGDRFDAESGRVNAMILAYGVLVHAPWSHAGTWQNLSGGDPELAARWSLDKLVTAAAPPAFVWATFTDQAVDYRNSVLFAQAMAAAGRPCELHLYPRGDHGMLLGLETRDVSAWPAAAKNFLETQWESAADPEQVSARYTNAYQYAAEIRAGLTGTAR